MVARVVARVGDTCASVVRPAISGMTVAAGNTIGQTNRQIEFLKVDLGDVASLFMCITQRFEVLTTYTPHKPHLSPSRTSSLSSQQ